MNIIQTIGDLALDLKRVSIFLQRGSTAAAERFILEAQKRAEEIKPDSLPIHMQNVIPSIKHMLLQSNREKLPEDCLMYSALLQNYFLKSKGIKIK